MLFAKQEFFKLNVLHKVLHRGRARARAREGRGREYTHCYPTNSELRVLRHIEIISNEMKCYSSTGNRSRQNNY